MYINYQVSYL